MKRIFGVFLLVVAGLAGLQARADTVVLVHGYLGTAQSWDGSGITGALERNGWQRAGVYIAGPGGIRLASAPGTTAGKRYFTVDLPSEAPILIQVYQLQQVLRAVSDQNGKEPIVLVGHSAGGVVARAAIVRDSIPGVRALITIASPHLGTGRAEQALDVTDVPFPLSMVADFFGGPVYDTARRSRSLYIDLIRPRPGSLLYWLNGQLHPEIRYVSIVRGQPGGRDEVVPAYSQDMNNIPALRGRCSVIATPAYHQLGPQDGSIIANLLTDL